MNFVRKERKSLEYLYRKESCLLVCVRSERKLIVCLRKFLLWERSGSHHFNSSEKRGVCWYVGEAREEKFDSVSGETLITIEWEEIFRFESLDLRNGQQVRRGSSSFFSIYYFKFFSFLQVQKSYSKNQLKKYQINKRKFSRNLLEKLEWRKKKSEAENLHWNFFPSN